MPLTPTSWSGTDFGVNIRPGSANTQSRVTGLANGNILVSWIEYADGISTFDDKVYGQMFDPVGNLIGDRMLLQLLAGNDDAANHEVVALANGGFMLAYQENGADNDLYYVVVSASGNQMTSGYLLNDAAGGEVPNSPVLATGSTGSTVMTAYIVDNADGSEVVWLRAYNTANGTFAAAIPKFNGGTGVDDDINSVALAAIQGSSNFALAIANRNAGNDSVLLRIVDAAGTTLHSAAVSPGIELDDIQVTGLAGGNVALAWHNLSTARTGIAVYSNTGSMILGATTITGVSTNEPSIAALADGGFVLVWDDDNVQALFGQRFDSSGNPVGGSFGVAVGSFLSDPNVIGLADGRFQVSWVDNGDIRSEIFDVRDAPNSTGVYPPNSYVVGTIGNDIFTPTGNATIVHGWDGDDIITENLGPSTAFFGDGGNDRINVVSAINNDSFDGGTGNDTIDWSAVNETGATFRLIDGTATSASSAVEQMLNFENLNGTQFADTIYGTNGANIIYGNGGDDTIWGFGGNDILYGGAGNDYFVPLSGVDSVYGDEGDDFFEYAGSSSGGTLDGGAGNDTLFVYSAGGTVSFASISGIEAIIFGGNAPGPNLALTGTQFLNGFAFDGAISGSGTLTVNMDTDVYFFATSMTFSGSVSLVINGTSGFDVIKMGHSRNTINAGDTADQIRGGNLVDTIFGEGGGDKIMGRGGADVITGGAGDDRFRYIDNADSGFGAARDRITDFTSGQDMIDFSWFDGDAVTAGDQAFTFVGTAVFTNTGIGQLRYTTSGGDILLQADTNGDGVADMEIILQGIGASTLTAADFIL